MPYWKNGLEQRNERLVYIEEENRRVAKAYK